MTHRLATNYAKNYCNRTPIVKVIVENVVTCFLGGHGVVLEILSIISLHAPFTIFKNKSFLFFLMYKSTVCFKYVRK